MPIEPTEAEVIRKAIDARLLDVHTAMPGVVEKYDSARQVADIRLVVKHAYDTADGVALEELPVLPEVPIVWPRTALASMHMPLAAGDGVLVVFTEADDHGWRKNAQAPGAPGDLQRHGLSYGYAIPGCSPEASRIPATDVSGTDVVLNVTGGSIRMGGPTADFVALASKTDTALNTILDLLKTWAVVANDGGLALQTAAKLITLASVASSKLKGE